VKIDNNNFYIDGKPSFYLADTCWSAFTNIEISDWIYYLNYRRKQGFNVIQVNMLWQWDSSKTDLDLLPFELKSDGTFDFSKVNEEYFDRAGEMIKIAYEQGFTIGLVLLWANYLPDTWATLLKETSLFPKEKIESYVDFVMQKYNQYKPIYIVSGDTDFPNDNVIDYYEIAMNRVKENDPNSIATLHIRGREKDLPQRLLENKNLDFYMFQSGHNRQYQYMAYELAEEFYSKEPQNPSINSEPCYELMGYSRNEYGRFTREDVRKVAWQSVLSGAKAGITYGAHGIWSWHSENMEFDSTVGEAFATPYDWHDALQFEGAWDYAFIKNFLESENLLDIVPVKDLILNETKEIRVSENDKKIIIYIPSNITLQLNEDYSTHSAYFIDLESKKEVQAKITKSETGKGSYVKMHPYTKDALLIIKK